MGHITLCFSVQLYETGAIGVHSWHATYTPTGRQVPRSDVTAHDVDDVDLAYLLTEFGDRVELARRQLAPLADPLPF